MKRREFITLVGGAATAWPLAARAQSDRLRRIGVLMNLADGDPDGHKRVTTFSNTLQQLGWTEGRNIRIETRWAVDDANRLQSYAAELVGMKPDLILATASNVLAALRRETQTIPIVFVFVSDPVGQGFVVSLARPGGNATGFTSYEFSMIGKWLELLKEIAPRVTRVSVMFNPVTAPYGEHYLQPFEVASRSIAVKPIAIRVRSEADVADAMSALSRESGNGVVFLPDTFIVVHRQMIISLANKYSIPTIHTVRLFTASGGLLSYGIDVLDLFRRAGTYADRILKGAKPSDLPVQQPTKFELVVNLKTAKALGLDVPLQLQQRADEVIE